MTTNVIRKEDGHIKEIIISCDADGCDAAPNNTTLLEGGGLKKMGWTLKPVIGGLQHYCPEHSKGVTNG